jgi:hypothetical protein
MVRWRDSSFATTDRRRRLRSSEARSAQARTGRSWVRVLRDLRRRLRRWHPCAPSEQCQRDRGGRCRGGDRSASEALPRRVGPRSRGVSVTFHSGMAVRVGHRFVLGAFISCIWGPRSFRGRVLSRCAKPCQHVRDFDPLSEANTASAVVAYCPNDFRCASRHCLPTLKSVELPFVLSR